MFYIIPLYIIYLSSTILNFCWFYFNKNSLEIKLLCFVSINDESQQINILYKIHLIQIYFKALNTFYFIIYLLCIFDVDHFFKSLLNLLQHCFCFMFWFFGLKACGILAPRPGIDPAPPALESKVLTTGPPGKSPNSILSVDIIMCKLFTAEPCSKL